MDELPSVWAITPSTFLFGVFLNNCDKPGVVLEHVERDVLK